MAGPAAPHLCTPVDSPYLDPLAPEATSPEPPGGPLEPQPPVVPSRAGQGLFCSSLRQPNLPNQSAWEGRPSSLLPTGAKSSV